jgi:hypothetical protein
MEAVLEWMDRMEEATIRIYHADFDRTYLEFHQTRKENPRFDEEMHRYKFWTEKGIRKWNKIKEWTEEAENRRGEVWRWISTHRNQEPRETQRIEQAR